MADYRIEVVSCKSLDEYIGQRLKARRTMMGISQTKLGESLGVTFQQIQKYEKGVNKISIPNLYKIAEVLKTDINYFLNEDSVTSALNDCECGVKYNNESCQDNMESSMYKKEVISLVKYFTRIKSKKIRSNIITLLKSFSEDINFCKEDE